MATDNICKESLSERSYIYTFTNMQQIWKKINGWTNLLQK